jgi:hypothetical protein
VQEIGSLRDALHTEMEGLRVEVSELKTALKQQLELLASAEQVSQA